MSDNSSKGVPHEGSAGNCDMPGCVYHAMMNAKVRAVQVDGLTYVEVEDLAMFLTATANWNYQLALEEILRLGQENNFMSEVATTNFLIGVRMSVDVLENLHSAPISTLDYESTPLVSPEATKSPAAVPAEWTEWMERAKKENKE